MRISNELYDILKLIVVRVIPAFEVLILTLGDIWDIPYYTQIGATVAAIGVFMAAVMGVSSVAYKRDNAEGIVFEDRDTEIDDDEI